MKPIATTILLAALLLGATPAQALLEMPGQESTGLARQNRHATVQSFINDATDCIARAVMTDPRHNDVNMLSDLIVASMPKCVGPMRTMIERLDEFIGAGFGETFFGGPYLDRLPAAIQKRLAEMRATGPAN